MYREPPREWHNFYYKVMILLFFSVHKTCIQDVNRKQKKAIKSKNKQNEKIKY